MNFKEFQKRNAEAVAYLNSSQNSTKDKEQIKRCLQTINFEQQHMSLFNITVGDFVKYFNEYLCTINNQKSTESKIKLIIEDINTDRKEFKDPYSSNPEPTEIFKTTYVVSMVLKDTEETIQLTKGQQSLLTNNAELKEKPITAEEIRTTNDIKNVKFNLLSNQLLHIPSILNPKSNMIVKSIDINDALSYIAKLNLDAQKQAKLDSIAEKRNELKATKAKIQKDENLETLSMY